MKKLPFLTAVLLGSVLLCACQPSNNSQYTDATGQSGSFSDYKGQWLIINYWAIWCKPCVEEIPELNTFQQAFNDKVKLFSVNFDGRQGEQLTQDIQKLDIQFSTLTQDPATMLGFKRPSVLPTTVILNTQGEIHATLKGPQTAEDLKQAIGL